MPEAGKPSVWPLMLGAAAILMITMGVRQSAGLFLLPLYADLALDYASISFAFAVGQLLWGAVQPVFGALAERWGSRPVLVVGALLLAAGLAATPLVTSESGLLLTMGVLSAAGAGGGKLLCPDRRDSRSCARRAPFLRWRVHQHQQLIRPLRGRAAGAGGHERVRVGRSPSFARRGRVGHHSARLDAAVEATVGSRRRTPAGDSGLLHHIAGAMRDRSYLCLHAGFFTCGFHVAFLVTHLPGEVHLAGCSAAVSAASIGIIGLFNIAGSLCAGALGTRYCMKHILALMYGSRAVMIAVFLMSPHTELVFYVFAAALGFTWLATVPPTAGLVAKLFDTRFLATLFGLTLLTHQIGGFLGAWLGGLAMDRFGNYQWMWYADIVLASAAALVNLPIREDRVGVHAAA